MAEQELHLVTGAYGFTGKYITKRLLEEGHRVRTLTNSPERENPFGPRVEAVKYHWEDPHAMAEAMNGAAALHNTFWIRFPHGGLNFEQATDYSYRLFEAAKQAGVPRVVHVSITNPSEDSRFAYFRGKAKVEQLLRESGLSHAILRPALLFGQEGILFNNIAWMLRRFPAFGTFGTGKYKMRPVHVDDLARLAVDHAKGRDNVVLDAVGPETWEFRALLKEMLSILGVWRPVLPMPAALGIMGATVMGKLMGDVILTRDEVEGLMAGLLWTEGPATADTHLSHWLRKNASWLGKRYMSEVARRDNRKEAYEKL